MNSWISSSRCCAYCCTCATGEASTCFACKHGCSHSRTATDVALIFKPPRPQKTWPTPKRTRHK